MIRTGYSFKVAVGHVRDVIGRLEEIGSATAPIADRCSTFGFATWTKQAKERGLRPVYGVELGVTTELGAKKQTLDYWTFLAKDSLRPLHDLIALATGNPGKEPSLLYRQAENAKGLIKIMGSSCLLDHVSGDKGDTFLGLSPATPAALYRKATRRGIALAARSCNSYPREEDRELYRVAILMSSVQTYPQHILSDDEWRASTSWFVEPEDQARAIATRDSLLESCRAEMRKATLFSPVKTKTLRQMCLDGAASLGVDLSSDVYSERLDRELSIIAEKEFEDYFYILADVVSWSRERMVVGPARGSSCGSLVCYLLGITTVDPIPYDLVFERFIDVTRSDLPDIDVDFSDKRRFMAFEYMEKKYGVDRVARLGTVGTYQPKSAMKLIGAALLVPFDMIDDVSNMIISRSMGDSRANNTLEDTLKSTRPGARILEEYPHMRLAATLEEHPANAGQHAAGVVLTSEPIMDFVAVDSRTKATMCDKYDAEALNLLKIDALGLTQLSTFERVLELIGKPSKGWLEALPLDDQATFDVLNNGRYAAVFQFASGTSLASITTEMCDMKPGAVDSFDDFVALTALVRPGPLSSGGTRSWMLRKVGREKITYFDPMFEPYLSETLGIAVYQEQVMRISREIGDLSWDEVNVIRRAMSKSYGREFFDQYGDKWKVGAIKRGLSQENANKMWDYMCTFGAMGFNKAHAVAYGMVSYWSCYLKAHFPLEYAAAALDAESEPATQLILLRELNKEGIGYIPVDAKRSTDRWEVAERDGRKVLVGPLTNIKGIGPKFLEQILHARRTGQDVKGALATKLANAETEIDSLTPVADALEEIGLANKKVVSRYVPIGEVAAGHGQTMIIGSIRSLDPTDLNNPVKLSKRGYALSGPALALNLILGDDTGEIACHVGRDIYEKIGIPMLEAGRVGKSIYAIKGSVVEGFRLFGVREVRYIGDLEEVKKRKRDAANGDRHGNDRPKRGRSDNRDRVRGDTGGEGGSVRVHAGEANSPDLPWS